MWWRRLAEVQTEHQNGEEVDLSDLVNVEWLLVPDGLVWVFQKLLIYWDFHAQPSLGFTENGLKKRKYPVAAVVWMKMPRLCQSQRRMMGRLVRDDRKATVTQITTRYNQGMQNTISEHTTHRTQKQMCSSSRRPQRVPLLSAKNRKRRLQFTNSPKLDNRWLEKHCMVWWVSISATIFRWYGQNLA